MNNLEKLISNLSNYWGISPDKVVDRLNFMDEQGINKIVDKMTKKFKNGGLIDCLRRGGTVSTCKCGKKIGIEKAQLGRVLGSEQYPHATRRDAIDSVVDQMGFSRQQARQAYRNQKAALRDQGFRGNQMRQNARYNMIDTAYPRATEEISRIEPLQVGPQINMPSNTLVTNNAGLTPVKRSGRPDILTFSNQSFDSAFANARKMGLSEFAWQGGQYDRYSTNLAPEKQSSAQKQEYDYNQELVENSLKKPGMGNKIKAGIMSTLNFPMK